jgi:predicted LPLAT superfamily acyltransferase
VTSPVEATDDPRGRWAGRERGGRFGNRFFAFLVRRGGLRLTPFFVFWVALYFLVAAPRARRASFELADRVGRGGGLFRRLWFAWRHLYTFGTLLIDRSAILGGQTRGYTFTEHGKEILLEHGRAGGVVLVTAHLGSWSVMGHLLRDAGKPVTLVMHDAVQPRMRRAMEELTRGRAFRILYTEGSPDSAARILDALRAGELVGIMGDRCLAGEGAAVPFLGGTASVLPYL